MLVRIDQHPAGPRLYLAGQRVHHGHVGALLVAFGAWLMFDDRNDLLPAPTLPWFDPEIGLTTTNITDGW